LRRPIGVTFCQLIHLSKNVGFPKEAPCARQGVQSSNRNKKPGVERRVNSSALRTDSLEARLAIILYS
jgi:hypothetical protein